MTTNEILSRSKISESDVIALYPYGSRVYGNFKPTSDFDFIAIIKKKTNDQFSDNQININIFDIVGHQTRLINHEISALECFFLNKELILIEKQKFQFKLNLGILRNSLSAKSSNSFVKAKKKLTVEPDTPENLSLGKKSLWHSFRILEFGIQIAKYNKIIDYSSCNDLFSEIMNFSNDWSNLFEKYKRQYNQIHSEFVKIAPKF